MKYVIVLTDGAADYPVPALGGRTPLEAAKIPHMDELAAHGACGLVKTVPDSVKPGSDTANLSVMGYDPTKCYTGRSPLEAVSMGIRLADDDVAMRCNLVTLSDTERFEDAVMVDYSAGEITTEEATALISAAAEALNADEICLYPASATATAWCSATRTPARRARRRTTLRDARSRDICRPGGTERCCFP